MSSATRFGRALGRRGARVLAGRLPDWRGVLVLTYHRIARGPDELLDLGVWSAKPDELDDQVAWLTRHAELVGPDQLDESLASRGRRVLLTFDDGYRDNFDVAYPILRAHSAAATFFLTTGFLDRTAGAWWDEIAWIAQRAGWSPSTVADLIARHKRLPADARPAFLDALAADTGAGRRPADDAAGDWMSWDHARELRAGGMTIGAHTVAHPILGGLPEERQHAEIGGAVERIAGELGERPSLFAFPDGQAGSHDEHSLSALRAAGVRFAFTNAGGVAGAPSADRLLLPRVNVWHGMSRERFRLLVSAPWALARP